MKIPENTLKEIKDKLNEYDKPCPMCNGTEWNIYTNYLFITHYDDNKCGNMVIRNACERCGFMCLYEPAKLLGYRPREIEYAD